jgi:DNA polymerase-3 subunit alpha
MTKPFWSLHTHSRFSANDALPKIADMVERAVLLDYPALGLTDHGGMPGSVQLYRACRKAGIEPLPGEEFYFTPDRETGDRSNYHLTVASYSEQGYRNLVGLHNLAQSNFYFRPRIDLADLAGLAEKGMLTGLVASSGCYFGLVMQTLEKRGPKAARRLVAALAGWFPRFYVELHDHGVVHPDGGTDADFVDDLVAIADDLGVPYIIAQDSHYLTPADQGLHDALKTLVSWSEDPSEAIFPGGPYSMVDNAFLEQTYPAQVLDRALDNLADLAERAHLRLPELETFTMRIPDVTLTGDADVELENRVSLKWLTTMVASDRVGDDRFYDEISIIRDSGFAGYLMLVADVCDFMRREGIWFQTRGSASGSLVCYLLGITQIDPLEAGLRMDRFMSRDRMKPPDVDLDVEHRRRDEVVAYLGRRFTVRQIGSHMKYSVTADPDDEDSSKGSLLVRYFSSAKKRGSQINTWQQIPATDQKILSELGAMELVSQAGTHAAGYIVSPDEQAAKQLPLTWIASRKAMVTSYAMKDVEALGFVKLDLLGLRTLTAIRITCDALGWSQEQFEAIPLDDKETYKRIGAGHTDAVFQLDGFAMMRGCRDLKPKNLDGVIAAQALFRPATMASGATKDYLARQRGKEEVPERNADITAETSDTYGVLLYQEQVIGVLRRMGMDAD